MKKQSKYKFNKSRHIELTSMSMIIVMMISSCNNNVRDTDITTSSFDSTSSIISSTETSDTQVSEIPTILDTTPTLVTELYTCPVDYNENTYFGVKNLLYSRFSSDSGFDDICAFGFDNEMLHQLLNDYVHNNSNYSDDVTIDQFHYFQFLQYNFSGNGGTSTSEICGNLEKYPECESLVRAVLIQENLNYIIDEIPASYFESRFPEFMDSISDNQYRYNLVKNVFLPSLDKIKDENGVRQISNFNNLSDYERDVYLFFSLYNYNHYRASYMYGPEIKQVRDLNTGKHVLVPDNHQLRILRNCLDDYEGYDFDIMQVEDTEYYHQCFGFYPNEILNNFRIYDGNKNHERSR